MTVVNTNIFYPPHGIISGVQGAVPVQMSSLAIVI